MIRNVVKLFCTQKAPINTKLVEQIITKAGQVETSDQQLQQLLEKRMKDLQKLHEQTQDLIDSKIRFPVKLCGTSDQYQTKYSYLPQRVMAYYRIPSARVTDYLLKMYKASLFAIADRNTQYMKEYWEEGFMKRTLTAIDEANEKNLKVRVEKDSNYLEQVAQSCEIIDSVMMRGLSIDRKQNKAPQQYIRYQEPGEMGFVTYTPRSMTDNNQNFIDPIKNKTAFQGYDRMLLRVLVRIKSPLRLNIPEFKVPKDVYTWEHLCVMENQMVAVKPLQSSYKLETLLEWLGKYRFGPWRVVDLDNFMLGNSPFREHQPENQQLDPVFKRTILDRSYHIDIRMI